MEKLYEGDDVALVAMAGYETGTVRLHLRTGEVLRSVGKAIRVQFF